MKNFTQENKKLKPLKIYKNLMFKRKKALKAQIFINILIFIYKSINLNF